MNETDPQSPLQDILLELMVQNEFLEKIHITSTKSLSAIMDSFRTNTESVQQGNGLLNKVLSNTSDWKTLVPILKDTLLESMVANETLEKIVTKLDKLGSVEVSESTAEASKATGAAPAIGGVAEIVRSPVIPIQTPAEKDPAVPFTPFTSGAPEGSPEQMEDAAAYARSFVDAINKTVEQNQGGSPENPLQKAVDEVVNHTAATSFRMSLLLDDVASILNLLTFKYEQDKEDQKTRLLQQEERDRELIKLLEKLGFQKEEEEKEKKPEEGWLGKIIGGLAILAGIVAGFIAGIVGYFKDFFGGILGKIGKLLKIGPLLEKMGINKFITGITEKFGGIFGKVGGFFSKILAPFEDILTLIKTKFTKFFSIGKVIGKIAGPLAILFEVFQSIFSAVDVFKKTGDIGAAIQEGVTSLVKNLIGGPLDLLKGVVSWILGALGLEQAEQFLDSFSFTDIIQVFLERLIDWGRQAFEMYFQTLVDAWSDISEKFSSGDILGGILEILRGYAKTLLGLPADLIKNSVASIGELFGADMSSLRKFSFRKLFGGTNTDIEAETAPSPNKGVIAESMEVTAGKKLAEEQKRVDEHIAEQDRALKEKTDEAESKMRGEKKDEGIFGFFNNFHESLLKAYKENAAGLSIASNIGPAPSNAGAQISAMQADTANLDAATESAAKAAQQASASQSKSSSVSANAITYNSNNVPDRTSWMLTPVGGMIR